MRRQSDLDMKRRRLRPRAPGERIRRAAAGGRLRWIVAILLVVAIAALLAQALA